MVEQGLVDGLRAQGVKRAAQAFEIARFEHDDALGEIGPPAGMTLTSQLISNSARST
jgi:hypothetical protein